MAKLCRGRCRSGANASDGTARGRWRLVGNKMLGDDARTMREKEQGRERGDIFLVCQHGVK